MIWVTEPMRWAAAALALMLGIAPAVAANTIVGPTPPRPMSAPVAKPHAPPRIVRIWLSGVVLSPGDAWSGAITTSTNVASVEARVVIFSLSVHRTDFGQFSFRVRIPRVPRRFHRPYTLELIARNADGKSQAAKIPISIR